MTLYVNFVVYWLTSRSKGPGWLADSLGYLMALLSSLPTSFIVGKEHPMFCNDLKFLQTGSE